MNLIYSDGPIIACSTGRSSNTAIGLIRISGFNKLNDLNQSFSIDLSLIEPGQAILCDLINQNKVIDNIVLVYYKGPKSYNGENILELSVHGNQINIENIINHFIKKYSYRIAREGEFTYRALINKKLSLSQVEGLDLLLNANSSLTFTNGMNSLQGKVQKEYISLRDTYLMLKGCIELSIDFSDDMGDEQSRLLLETHVQTFDNKINSLKHRIQGDLDSFTNPDIVLVGKTNAGKSSLFNSLLKINRSIVSSIAGTTRDYVSHSTMIDGTRFQLIDTAGIRSTIDEIEEIGIKRAIDVLDSSFFKILVVNPHDNEELNDYDLLRGHIFDVIIFTHKDLDGETDLSSLSKSLPKSSKYISLSLTQDGPIEPIFINDQENGPIEPLESSKTGPIEPLKSSKTGPIEPLKSSKAGPIGPLKSSKAGPIGPIINKEVVEYINNRVAVKYLKLHESEPILIDRQRECVNELYFKWADFVEILNSEDDIAIIASELRLLDSYLGELVGIITSDDVLNNLFANFCIGK